MSATTHVLRFQPQVRRGRLAVLGDWMAAHRRAILGVQWAIVVFYAVLVVLPAFLPAPDAEARLFSSNLGAATFVDANATTLHAMAPYAAKWYERLTLLAQYLFWGVWWPFVILSIMLMGRVWCGVLCPEGALTEFASRHGRGGAIPRWLRWGGWPLVAFVLITVYGQLISVYEYPQAALLILGGSTLAALLVGWLYGRGKRVWCRYLCPVSGVFALLARLSPVHFRVDRDAWARRPASTPAVDCPPLLAVAKLDGMAECHACGRCSGHRDAVALALRSPAAEIVGGAAPRTAEALLLHFGLLGVALGAFQWSVSPWFVALKQHAADWLATRNIMWPFNDSPAWWLLTRQPSAGDIFTWLDGAAIVAYIAAVALAIGLASMLATRAAARLAGVDWRRLSLALTPAAGIGLFLGLSMLTASDLRAEGATFDGWPAVRVTLLTVALLGSAWLAARVIGNGTRARPGKALAALLALLPLAAVAANWWLVFFVW